MLWIPNVCNPPLSSAWIHFITTIGAGLSAGRNWNPSSAPKTGTKKKKKEAKNTYIYINKQNNRLKLYYNFSLIINIIIATIVVLNRDDYIPQNQILVNLYQIFSYQNPLNLSGGWEHWKHLAFSGIYSKAANNNCFLQRTWICQAKSVFRKDKTKILLDSIKNTLYICEW